MHGLRSESTRRASARTHPIRYAQIRHLARGRAFSRVRGPRYLCAHCHSHGGNLESGGPIWSGDDTDPRSHRSSLYDLPGIAAADPSISRRARGLTPSAAAAVGRCRAVRGFVPAPGVCTYQLVLLTISIPKVYSAIWPLFQLENRVTTLVSARDHQRHPMTEHRHSTCLPVASRTSIISAKSAASESRTGPRRARPSSASSSEC